MSKLIRFLSDSKVRFLYLARLGMYNKMNDEEFLKKEFYAKTGKELNLENPKTFNEKLQWLKLYDRKDIYTTMVDKYEVKKYVAKIIGEEYIIPNYGVYDDFDDIDFDELPNQFVIKCTHDSGGLIIVKDKKKFNKRKARRKIKKFLKRKYFYEHREWPYKNVKPRIIVEKYIEDDNHALNDYKFFCFAGKTELILVCSDRFSDNGLKETWFDGDWKLLPLTEGGHAIDGHIRRPQKLEEMKKMASKLSKVSPFLRVDFYEIGNKLYFGEATFYPCAGYEQFTPEKWNYVFGEKIDLDFIDTKDRCKECLISVVVPTYNSAEKVNKLLTSIDKQSYRKYEIVFVDDGSTDGTIDILKEYKKGKKYVKIAQQRHGGPGLARKRGFEESNGEIIYFIDSDDWLADSGVLARINKEFLDNDVDMCLANRIVYPKNLVVAPFDGKYVNVKPGKYNLDLFYDHIISGNMSIKAFRKNIMSSEMFVGGIGHEDLCATYAYLDKCNIVKYVDDCFHVANRNDDNISLTKTKNYDARSLSDKAKNILETFNGIESPQIKNVLGAAALGVYCGFITNGLAAKNADIMHRLSEVIRVVDLSGFSKEYSLKKRIVLWFIKSRKGGKNED